MDEDVLKMGLVFKGVTCPPAKSLSGTVLCSAFMKTPGSDCEAYTERRTHDLEKSGTGESRYGEVSEIFSDPDTDVIRRKCVRLRSRKGRIKAVALIGQRQIAMLDVVVSASR